ncbi:MAG TPA: MerR family transcriptional regulator [Steroidobacteraceae bacterium]|jgi:DNA-binding transcriptional MerR regulator/methylmalonyl-CoA mutase cobalamin-binding subunit
MANEETLFNISAVERETGLSKDVLRIWERRYGFPRPERDENAERQYTAEELSRLRTIKRLMDTGLRPGKLIRQPLEELNALAEKRIRPRRETPPPAVESDVLALLKGHDVSALHAALTGWLLRHGLQRFVLETAAPLNRAVGEAWMHGDLQVFEEHLYSELLQLVLRGAINAMPRGHGTPRIVLTTLPGEQHGIGLLMSEALLASEGGQCISLGTQTPFEDIRRAVVAFKAQVLAVSFSTAFPLRQAGDAIVALRRAIASSVVLWAGGAITRRLRRTPAGVRLLPDIADVLPALQAWRTEPGASGAR